MRYQPRIAARRGTAMAVLVIDLDHFKLVNDTYGHVAGDRVLMITARRLTREVREGDVVTRIGGDEFVVILDEVSGVREAETIADRLARSVTEPIRIGSDHDVVRIGASIGIVTTAGSHEPTVDRLLSGADAAAYAAKAAGRGGSALFYQDMGQDSVLEKSARQVSAA